MNISELPALLFEGVLQKWKRRIIVYAICAVCALGILVETISIGRILLERAFGPVGGRLLVSGILLLVIAGAITALWQMEKRSRSARADEGVTGSENDSRVALLAQAISLGYTLARGFGTEKTDVPEPDPDHEQATATSRAGQAAE